MKVAQPGAVMPGDGGSSGPSCSGCSSYRGGYRGSNDNGIGSGSWLDKVAYPYSIVLNELKAVRSFRVVSKQCRT